MAIGFLHFAGPRWDGKIRVDSPKLCGRQASNGKRQNILPLLQIKRVVFKSPPVMMSQSTWISWLVNGQFSGWVCGFTNPPVFCWEVISVSDANRYLSNLAFRSLLSLTKNV